MKMHRRRSKSLGLLESRGWGRCARCGVGPTWVDPLTGLCTEPPNFCAGITARSDCAKAPHEGTGHSHPVDYDGPVSAGSFEFCGRCHGLTCLRMKMRREEIRAKREVRKEKRK